MVFGKVKFGSLFYILGKYNKCIRNYLRNPCTEAVILHPNHHLLSFHNYSFFKNSFACARNKYRRKKNGVLLFYIHYYGVFVSMACNYLFYYSFFSQKLCFEDPKKFPFVD